MSNKFKFLLIVLVAIIIIPQVTLAAWWNPPSWNPFSWFLNIFKSQPQQTDTNLSSMLQPDANTIPITILSPKTGDIWAQGYKKTVSWSSKPITQSNTIIYSLEGGPTPGDFLSYQTNSIGATYSHTLGVPSYTQGKNVQTGTYRLKITVYTPGQPKSSAKDATKPIVLAQGISGYFKIVPESQSLVKYVSVSINGHGSVNSATGISPIINCPDPFTTIRGICSAAYPLNQTVTLVAIPASGYVFAGWSGDCSGNSLNCTVSVNAEKNVQAGFSEIQTTPPPGV
jgi:uncharacterized repeat protein (TIGR02543 family)